MARGPDRPTFLGPEMPLGLVESEGERRTQVCSTPASGLLVAACGWVGEPQVAAVGLGEGISLQTPVRVHGQSPDSHSERSRAAPCGGVEAETGHNSCPGCCVPPLRRLSDVLRALLGRGVCSGGRGPRLPLPGVAAKGRQRQGWAQAAAGLARWGWPSRLARPLPGAGPPLPGTARRLPAQPPAGGGAPASCAGYRDVGALQT